ncbi:MAG: GGDEF domain-containing protein [Thermoanaerobaculales bacterium]|nr:GGDEF domain-containing protein [Thermoanaerobaculales bacterium]
MSLMIDRHFRDASRPMIISVSVLLVAAVAAVDDATGQELSFSIFYLIPVSLAAWYGGRYTGYAVSILSALAWLAVDMISGKAYSGSVVPFWNATVRLGFFVLVAHLLASLRIQLTYEETLARIDALTGVTTGRAFRQSAGDVIGLAARNGRPFILVYIDLDDFKKVNDSSGHAEGDRALKAVASCLARSVRRTDIVGRLGGDEFAVLLPETDEAGAREVIGKIRANIVSTTNDGGWPIGASIGAAVFLTPPQDPNEAIARADDLMYQAKKSGKNQTVFSEVSIPASHQHGRWERQDTSGVTEEVSSPENAAESCCGND